MEDRRLKNILSHLSPCSFSTSGNSAVSTVINKAEVLERVEKSHEFSSDNAQWSPAEQKAYKSMAKSRSSSNIFESRQSGFAEEMSTREVRWYPTAPSSQCGSAQSKTAAQRMQSDFSITSLNPIPGNPSLKNLTSHSFTPHCKLTAQNCGCLLRSTGVLVEGGPLCRHVNDRGVTSRQHVQGYSLDTTSVTASPKSWVQSCPSTGVEHVSKDFEFEEECTSFKSNKVPGDALQEGEANHTAGVIDEREVFRVQMKRIYVLEPRADNDDDKDAGGDLQTSNKALDLLRSSVKQKFLTGMGIGVLDSPPGDVGADAPGNATLSRNNAMTGQRRRIVEDCIFCLIIQGQSPAFKLYEDEMCICILDVHPIAPGHSLIIPKAHFPSLEFTPPEVAAAMCATVPFISMAIMQATNCDSFNLLVNSGKAAGQVVFHTHFHVIPRRSGDNLWRSEDDCRRALPVGHETAMLVQKIRHNILNKCL